MLAIEILQFVKAADSYPNVSFAYRILLTIPVIVASAERSFSKLKLLRNCLRSTMSQERLNGLAMCSIEKDIWMTLILIQFLKIFEDSGVITQRRKPRRQPEGHSVLPHHHFQQTQAHSRPSLQKQAHIHSRPRPSLQKY